MATITRENIGNLTEKISVKIKREEYLDKFEKSLKQLSKKANLPGFRKGMVPVGLIKKMHGNSLFNEEVIKTVNTELETYLRTEQLAIFGQPLPIFEDLLHIDMQHPEDYTFDFEVGLKPEININETLQNLKLTKYTIAVSDADVEEEVQHFQKRFGTKQEIDAIANEENIIELSFVELDDQSRTLDDGISHSEHLALKFIIESERKLLIGKSKDYTFESSLAQLFEEKELEWILKDWKLDREGNENKRFRISITKIEEVIPKELTEELFKEALPNQDLKTADEFKQYISKDLSAYWDKESQNRLDHEIFESLVHKIPMELPSDFLKKWIQRNTEKPITEQQVAASFPQYDHQLRWNLITDKIIADNHLNISIDELKEASKARLLGYFGGMNMPEGNQGWLDSYVDNLLKDEKYVQETYQELLTSKVFSWLREHIQVTEKALSTDEFIALPSNHHHHEHE